ncbi:MAG: hypothetical protein ACXADD_17195 [Candidatus Thorarchaeota archaeon]|jgi:hypothetical protein
MLFTQDADYAYGRGVSVMLTDFNLALAKHGGNGPGTASGIQLVGGARSSGDYHYKVILNETTSVSGRFIGWENDVLVWDTVTVLEDITYGYFGFKAWEDTSIDNIVVTEIETGTTTTIPTTTTTTTTPPATTPSPPPPAEIPMELLVGGVAVIAVVVIVVVAMKLRR